MNSIRGIILVLIHFVVVLPIFISFSIAKSNSRPYYMKKAFKVRQLYNKLHDHGNVLPDFHVQSDYVDQSYYNNAIPTENGRQIGLGNRLESSPALVLNADYTPLSLMPLSLWYWQDALKAVLTGKANVIMEYSLRVRSVRHEYAVPSVIALTEYHKPPNTSPALTRRNVYIRDGFRCQYCSDILPPADLTLDHVIPRSKGGKLSWTNTVAACRECNVRKSDYTPEELPRLGMRLKSMPRVPTHFELQSRAKSMMKKQIHPHWADYI